MWIRTTEICFQSWKSQIKVLARLYSLSQLLVNFLKKEIDFIFQSFNTFMAKLSGKHRDSHTLPASIAFPFINIPHKSGAFIGESTLTHHYQSPQFTLGFSPGVIYFVGLDKCVMICLHHDGVIQSIFYCPKNPLCLFIPSPSQTFAIAGLYSVSIILPFFRIVHRVGIIQPFQIGFFHLMCI